MNSHDTAHRALESASRTRHNKLVRGARCDKLEVRGSSSEPKRTSMPQQRSQARLTQFSWQPTRGHRASHTIHRSGLYRRILSSCLLLALLIACDVAVRAQDSRLSKLEAQYENEMSPVGKAKLLAKLGPLEVDEAAREIKADQDETAFTVLERYRDSVRTIADALNAAQTNPVRHPAGFKELQIGLRQSLRRLGDLLLLLPSDEQPRLEALRSDLTTIQNSLIEALFPSPKDKQAKERKAD